MIRVQMACGRGMPLSQADGRCVPGPRALPARQALGYLP